MAQLTMQDYENVSKKEKPARKIKTYNIIRKNYRIFINSCTKTCLTKYCSKRLFDDICRNENTFFSFPLHVKPYLKIEWFCVVCFFCFLITLFPHRLLYFVFPSHCTKKIPEVSLTKHRMADIISYFSLPTGNYNAHSLYKTRSRIVL